MAGEHSEPVRMKFATGKQISLALKDLIDGTRNWLIWYVLGVSEVRQRYRRSVIGPFWVTISMGIQAVAMGFVMAVLFKIDVHRFLPFLCISLVTWNFFSNVLMEGSNAFISMGQVILQIKRPLWTYMMLAIWRNAIIYAHTVLVFLVAALVYGIYPTTTYFMIPLGLMLLLLNVGWMGLAAGLISARFRDVPLMIQSAFSVLVWVTPVYYKTDQLGPRVRFVIELNPLTYVMEVARAPFLNETPSALAWSVAGGLALIGWAVTFMLFVRTRPRLTYWL